jgi:DNA modification methylase
MTAPYITDEAIGDDWTMLLGDSCERLAELADESVDLSCYSPPFRSLYIYSASPRDLGNSADRETFMEHYSFIIRELLRVTKPGRLSCVHAADVATTKAAHGVSGLHDFPGDVIRAHQAEGWIFYGRWFVDKNPQAIATRTKAQHLLFVTKNRDSAKSAPAAGDQLLLFLKPGENAAPIKTDVSNEEWIEFAHPVWLGIREGRTLNAAIARGEADERHLHALQLDFIERCIRLWSNPGELIVSPFAGVGSEIYAARTLGRRGWGCELKIDYFQTAVRYLRELDDKLSAPTFFDDEDEEVPS